jgi:hypothetical protein
MSAKAMPSRTRQTSPITLMPADGARRRTTRSQPGGLPMRQPIQERSWTKVLMASPASNGALAERAFHAFQQRPLLTLPAESLLRRR